MTVLDPACGSGNFLYVSLALLKGLEKEAIAWAGLQGVRFEPRVHPRQLLGIEINPYAHELAAIVIWIGYLQWKQRNIIPLDNEEPILQKLDQITLMDAIVDRSHPAGPREPEWPAADVIVGNPPFLGAGKLRTELGDKYVEAMFELWERAGQRQGCRPVLLLAREGAPHGRRREGEARWATGDAEHRGGGEPRDLADQGVRRHLLRRVRPQVDSRWRCRPVSMVGFDDGSETRRCLDGRPVEGINANSDERASRDAGVATRCRETPRSCPSRRRIKVGAFEIEEEPPG